MGLRDLCFEFIDDSHLGATLLRELDVKCLALFKSLREKVCLLLAENSIVEDLAHCFLTAKHLVIEIVELIFALCLRRL